MNRTGNTEGMKWICTRIIHPLVDELCVGIVMYVRSKMNKFRGRKKTRATRKWEGRKLTLAAMATADTKMKFQSLPSTSDRSAFCLRSLRESTMNKRSPYATSCLNQFSTWFRFASAHRIFNSIFSLFISRMSMLTQFAVVHFMFLVWNLKKKRDNRMKWLRNPASNRKMDRNEDLLLLSNNNGRQSQSHLSQQRMRLPSRPTESTECLFIKCAFICVVGIFHRSGTSMPEMKEENILSVIQT